MSATDDLGDFFAPPPFDPAKALLDLERRMRDLKLTARGGTWELRGQPVVRAAVDGAGLAVQIARRPVRTPDWDARRVVNGADVRHVADEVKKRLARWADGDDS